MWTQELRLAGGKNRFHWVGGAFYSHNKRDYGQRPARRRVRVALAASPPRDWRAPKDVLFFSDLHYKLDQFALFGEGTLAVGDALDLTAGLRYYNFSEDRTQIFDGIFGNDNNGTSLVSNPGSTEASGFAPRLIASYKAGANMTLNAQASTGFRLGGINDPLNVPLCTPPTSSSSAAGRMEGRDGLELRGRREVARHEGPRRPSTSPSSTWRSATSRPP